MKGQSRGAGVGNTQGILLFEAQNTQIGLEEAWIRPQRCNNRRNFD